MADETSLIHDHPVVDDDLVFRINPNTRMITYAADNLSTVLIQHDHDSERITFEIPKEVDGHDMELCNVVEVHFLNVNANPSPDGSDTSSASLYTVNDLKPKTDDPNTLTFTWLVDGLATKYVGPLNFAVLFRCVVDVEKPNEDDENIMVTVKEDIYRWGTRPFVGLNVLEGLNSVEGIDAEYIGVVEMWESKIEEIASLWIRDVQEEISNANVVINNASNKLTTDISGTVTNAKSSAKAEIDAYVEEVKTETRKDLMASALDAKEIIVQEPGAATDRVMSQAATTEQITAETNALSQKYTDLDSKTSAKFKEIDDAIGNLGLSSFNRYEHLHNVPTGIPLVIEPDYTYYVKPLDITNTKGVLTYPFKYMYHNVGYEDSSVLVMPSQDHRVLLNAELDEYEKYQTFELIDIYLEEQFDGTGYVMLDKDRFKVLRDFYSASEPGNSLPILVDNNMNAQDSWQNLIYADQPSYSYKDEPHGTLVAHIYVTNDGVSHLSKGCLYDVYMSGDGELIEEYYVLEHRNWWIRPVCIYKLNGTRYIYRGDKYTIRSSRTPVTRYADLDGNGTVAEYSLDAITSYYVPGVSGYPKLVKDDDKAYALTLQLITSAYRCFTEMPFESEEIIYTISANGISSVTGPVKSNNGLKDTYTIIFDDGKTQTVEVNHGRSITSIEKTAMVNDEDIYEIRFNDGTKQTFTVPNVEANRSYLEDNVEDIHSILNEFGATTTEKVSELTNVINVPERTSKYARLNSFGGMSRKKVVPTTQGNNLIPFPYGGDNFGTDGAGWITVTNESGAMAEFVSGGAITVEEGGPYKFKIWFGSGGSPYIQIAYTHDGQTISYSGIVYDGAFLYGNDGSAGPAVNVIRDDDNRVVAYEVIIELSKGDVITRFSISDDTGLDSGFISAGGAIYFGYSTTDINPDTGESEWYTFFYEDDEWVPRVAQYKFEHTKLQAIKSVGANLIPFPYVDSGRTTTGVIFTSKPDGSVTVKGTSTGTAYHCLSGGFAQSKCSIPSWLIPGRTYAVSGGYTDGKGVVGVGLYLYDESGANVLTVRSGNSESGISRFTMPEEAVYYGLFVEVFPNQSADTTIYPMLNSGDTAMPWEPYVEHVYTIPSDIPTPDGFEANDGTLCQDIVDVKNHTYTPNVETIVFTGDEGWTLYGSRTENVFSIFTSVIRKGICSEYPSTTDTANFGVKNCVYMAHSSYIIISDLDCATASDLVNKLRRLHASGTPVTIKCVRLTEPEAQPLPTRLDKLIPVEPNGHLFAVTNTGKEVPIDVEFTVVGPNINDILDGINATLEALLNGGA